MPTAYEKVILEEGGFKVELSNKGTKPKNNPNPTNIKKEEVNCWAQGCKNKTTNMNAVCTAHKKQDIWPIHAVDWIGRVIPPGYTKEDCKSDVLPHSHMMETLVQWAEQDASKGKIADDFIADVLESIVSNIPDATSLQENLEGNGNGMTPDGFVTLVLNLTDKHFPKERFSEEKVNLGEFKKKSLDKMPIRVLATILILAVGCEESNRGDAYFCKKNGRVSKYGNAYMPTAYYILRRHTKANPFQAKMCVKG